MNTVYDCTRHQTTDAGQWNTDVKREAGSHELVDTPGECQLCFQELKWDFVPDLVRLRLNEA